MAFRAREKASERRSRCDFPASPRRRTFSTDMHARDTVSALLQDSEQLRGAPCRLPQLRPRISSATSSTTTSRASSVWRRFLPRTHEMSAPQQPGKSPAMEHEIVLAQTFNASLRELEHADQAAVMEAIDKLQRARVAPRPCAVAYAVGELRGEQKRAARRLLARGAPPSCLRGWRSTTSPTAGRSGTSPCSSAT